MPEQPGGQGAAVWGSNLPWQTHRDLQAAMKGKCLGCFRFTEVCGKLAFVTSDPTTLTLCSLGAKYRIAGKEMRKSHGKEKIHNKELNLSGSGRGSH